MSGAKCNTDHQMSRVKLLMKPKKCHKRPRAGNQSRKFNVSKLRGPANDKKEKGVESDNIKYKWACREARLMTREAKNRWFLQKPRKEGIMERWFGDV